MPTRRLVSTCSLFTLIACSSAEGTAPRDSDGKSDSPNSRRPDASVREEQPTDTSAVNEPDALGDAAVQFGSGTDGGTVVSVDLPDSGNMEPAGPLEVSEPAVAPSFMRGLNFGNRLDAPNEGEWGPKLRESDFATLAERGFDHVRLPVRFSAHAFDAEPFTIDDELLERVDWAIEQALAQELSLVLDFQYYDELMQAPEEHSERFLALWAQIAERYQNLPPHVAFELLSEPNGALEATYNDLVAQTVDVIRATNPERTLIVDSFDYAQVPTLSELDLPDDPNVVATVHLYTPQEYTFQGAPWADARLATTGIVFPGPPAEPIVPVAAALEDPATAAWFEAYNTLPEAENPSGTSTLESAVEALVEFRGESGHEVYVGEFGATTNGPEDSRFRYFETLRTLLEAEGIGWAVWDNNGSDMAVLGTAEGTFLDSTVDALIPADR